MQTLKQHQNLENELNLKLHQLTREFRIERVYFHPATATQPGHLLIIPSVHSDALVVQNREWLRNLYRSDNILPHIISFSQWEYGLHKGNPFLPFYSREEYEIYRHHKTEPFSILEWKTLESHFIKYNESFYHDRDLWQTAIRAFEKSEAPAAVFFTYLNLFAHDLTYLEELYIGIAFADLDLHMRIRQLLPYFPEISRWFVKENGNSYYLIRQLERAKAELSANEDAYVNYELLQAVQTTEAHLYDAVSSRFKSLQSAQKQFLEENSIASPVIPAREDKQLNEILSTLNRYSGIEEIYLFHKTLINSKPTNYFLLIGNKMGSGFLSKAQHSLQSRFPEMTIVLIGHSREWIQKELWISQPFFQMVMQQKNRVFTSCSDLPEIHWEHLAKCEYPDLIFYAKSAKRLAQNYKVLRGNTTKQNPEGLSLLFSHTFLRVLQVICFARLSYHPLHSSLQTVWLLCLYGSPELAKMEFLFYKLHKDQFFPTVARSLHYNMKMSVLTKGGLKIQDEILKVLFTEMEKILKELENQNLI